jgi:hypothetical protein
MAQQCGLARRFYWRVLWLVTIHMFGVWLLDDARGHSAQRIR